MRKVLPWLVGGFLMVLCGCQTSATHKIALENSPVISEPASVQPVVNHPQTSAESLSAPVYSEAQAIMKQLGNDATAQEIANSLTNIEALGSSAQVSDQDRRKIFEIENTLLPRLREQVKQEVNGSHSMALKSKSYREGYDWARQAEAALILYPLDESLDVIKDAEELSFRQQDVLRRLELIRRQRYNHWAARQAEKALKEIREKKKQGRDAAIYNLRIVEPSLLESSVAALYSYTVDEIVDMFSKDEKATVAKELTGPTVMRRGLEEF